MRDLRICRGSSGFAAYPLTIPISECDDLHKQGSWLVSDLQLRPLLPCHWFWTKLVVNAESPGITLPCARIPG